MNSSLHPDAPILLQNARTGDLPSIGTLLKQYTSYLTLIARAHLGKRLQIKVDPDDLVQETFLEAHRQFPSFRGTSEGELTAWLRCIMAGQIALTMRRYLGTRARDLHMERELAAQLEDSSHLVDRGLVNSGTSPSQSIVRSEQALLLAEALQQLSETYREVIVLRHIEQLGFAEVAARMNRTEDSVQKIWVRALAQLRHAMGARQDVRYG